MSVVDYSWLYVLAAILTLALNLAAVVFLFTKWQQYPRPTKWALFGFGLILLSQIGFRVLIMLTARVVSPDSFILVNAVASLASLFVHFAGLCMLIVAVYVDRKAQSVASLAAASLDADRGGRPNTRTEDSNPYAV